MSEVMTPSLLLVHHSYDGLKLQHQQFTENTVINIIVIIAIHFLQLY